MATNDSCAAPAVEAAQIDALFSRAGLVYSVNVVNSIIAAFFLWNSVSASALFIWMLAVLGVNAARFFLLSEYKKNRHKPLDYWKKVLAWGSAASGIAWGSAAVFLFPHGLVLQQIFLLVLILGMMAGSAVSWQAYFPAFLHYFIPVVSFITLRFLLEIAGNSYSQAVTSSLGVLFLVFSAGLYLFARNSNRMLAQLLLAKFEKRASDDRYRSLFHGAKVPMLLIDPENGRITDANEASSDYYGYPTGKLKQMTIAEINTLSFDEIAGKMANVMQNNESCFHFRHRLANGEIRDVEVHSGPVSLEDHRMLYSIVHDITERKLAEESQKLAALVFQSSNEAIVVTDENDLVVEVNPAFTATTGYAPDAISGKIPGLLKSEKHDQEFYAHMKQTLSTYGRWQGEIWDRRKSGELYALWASISLIRNPEGEVYRHVIQFSDITERKLKDEIIWRQANYDALTGLPNRRLFRDRLETEIKKSHRTGHSLALLFIDLDRFKEVNDTMGHDMGDRLLVEAAQRICRCVREADTVARLGGDEFTVILSELGGRVHLERIAQSIITELCKPFMLNSEAAYISASIGLTFFPEDALDIETLLKNADQAMYSAKAKGRNRFGYFTESMQRDAQEKISLTNDLRMALARNELEVYYQPIIEMASGRIAKAEALLRWKHEGRGMVGPDSFIPLAEESGLIVEIGEWVFNEAVSCVERWHEKFGYVIPVSINKSPVQFAEESIDKSWLERVIKHGLPGNSITVEITEGLLLKELPKVKERLLAFHDGGIEVSIDDFGTGFSSLSYLRQFDVDYLKIDRSFVHQLHENESDQALAEAIIVMAHKLGIKTIAEGVETEEQHELLASWGCDFAQGFLYSRPVPAPEFEAFLERGNRAKPVPCREKELNLAS